jgi:hypothetical protein
VKLGVLYFPSGDSKRELVLVYTRITFCVWQFVLLVFIPTTFVPTKRWKMGREWLGR